MAEYTFLDYAQHPLERYKTFASVIRAMCGRKVAYCSIFQNNFHSNSFLTDLTGMAKIVLQHFPVQIICQISVDQAVIILSGELSSCCRCHGNYPFFFRGA